MRLRESGALIYCDLEYVTRVTNAENCKLNPESPHLRLLSCFSNVAREGKSLLLEDFALFTNDL